jgi:hypothetical protein
MMEELTRTLRLLLCAMAVAVMLVPAAGATTSPSTLFASILDAGEQQQSVHYISTASSTSSHVVQVADVGPGQGIQRITCTCKGQLGHVTVLVTGGNAYVLGDTFGLINYMGFNADAATTYSERWVQIPPTDRNFKAVSSDVTLPSSIIDLSLPRPLRPSPNREVKGRAVIGVTGTVPATAGSPALTMTLYARASGTPLPVEEDVVKGDYSGSVSFSHWNERLHIATPPDATPISITGLESLPA